MHKRHHGWIASATSTSRRGMYAYWANSGTGMTPGRGLSEFLSRTARMAHDALARRSTASEGLARDSRLGAYGLRILGVDVPAAELIQAPDHWPALELRVRVTDAPPRAPEHINGRSAHLVLRAGGSVIVDRIADRA